MGRRSTRKGGRLRRDTDGCCDAIPSLLIRLLTPHCPFAKSGFPKKRRNDCKKRMSLGECEDGGLVLYYGRACRAPDSVALHPLLGLRTILAFPVTRLIILRRLLPLFSARSLL